MWVRRTRAVPLLALAALTLAACNGERHGPAASDPRTKYDASGQAPPQPNPNGGDTPRGVADPNDVPTARTPAPTSPP